MYNQSPGEGAGHSPEGAAVLGNALGEELCDVCLVALVSALVVHVERRASFSDAFATLHSMHGNGV